MSDQSLPKLINPARLAEKHATLTGTLSLATMSRLTEFLADSAGQVTVTLDFSQDQNHSIFAHLKVDANLILQCQRCMGNFDFPISVDTLLRLVKDEIRSSGEEDYELFLMEAELIVLQDMIEDEILLNLPIIAKHPQDVCSMVLSVSSETPAESPFKNLLKIWPDRNKKHG